MKSFIFIVSLLCALIAVGAPPPSIGTIHGLTVSTNGVVLSDTNLTIRGTVAVGGITLDGDTLTSWPSGFVDNASDLTKDLQTNTTIAGWNYGVNTGLSAVNIRWFGATGDYTATPGADDTAALKAALAEISNSKVRPGAVSLPAGEYRISSTVYVTNRMDIVGDGPQKSRLMFSTNSTGLPFLVLTNVDNVIFKDLSIENHGDGTLQSGIRMLSSGTKSGNCTRIRFENVTFKNWQSNAVYAENAPYLDFVNCNFIDCKSLNNVAGPAVAVFMTNDVNTVHFSNCKFNGNDWDANFYNGYDVTFTGCTLEQTSSASNSKKGSVYVKNIEGFAMFGSYIEGVRANSSDAAIKWDGCTSPVMVGGVVLSRFGGVNYSDALFSAVNGTTGARVSGMYLEGPITYYASTDASSGSILMDHCSYYTGSVFLTNYAQVAPYTYGKVEFEEEGFQYRLSPLTVKVENDASAPILSLVRAVSGQEWSIHENSDSFTVRDVTQGGDRLVLASGGLTNAINETITAVSPLKTYATNGMGSALILKGSRGDLSVQPMAAVAGVWSNTTAGVEKSSLWFGVNSNSSLVYPLKMDYGGSVETVGSVTATNLSAPEVAATTGLTLGGFRRTTWPTSGGSAIEGTVLNSVAASGLLSVDAAKTNGIAATPAHVIAALGYTPQPTNDALGALSANPNLYMATNANLTAWQALATSAKQNSSANLDNWSATATNLYFLSANLERYGYIWIDAAAMHPTNSTAPETKTLSFTNTDQQIDAFAFASDLAEPAYFKLSMPDNWDRYPIKAKFYWSCLGSGTNASTTNGMRWTLSASAVHSGGGITSTIGTAQGSEITNAGPEKLNITPATPAITVNGSPALGDQVFFQVLRTTTAVLHTYTNIPSDGFLHGVQIQYGITNTPSASW